MPDFANKENIEKCLRLFDYENKNYMTKLQLMNLFYSFNLRNDFSFFYDNSYLTSK